MRESQTSIIDWAVENFGQTTTLRAANRANQEMAELLTVYTAQPLDTAKLIVEAADVAIVLARVERALAEHEDIEPEWPDLIASGSGNRDDDMPVDELVAQATLNMAGLINDLIAQDIDEAGLSCHMLMRNLADLVTRLGGDLPSAIDAKMEINRKRIWRPDGTGHGYHTHAEVPA